MPYHVHIVAMAAMAALSCSSCPGPPDGAGDAAREEGEPAPEASVEPRPCDEIERDLWEAVASSPNHCDADGDCACYAKEYRKGWCGAVTHKDTIPRLESLGREASAAGCEYPKPCPGFECKPHCRPRGRDDGFCTRLDRCVELSERFESVLAGASTPCKSADDCGTYRAGVGMNCGGATDGKTAKVLAKIAEEFFAEECRYTVNCAPRGPMHVECRSGMCLLVTDQEYVPGK